MAGLASLQSAGTTAPSPSSSIPVMVQVRETVSLTASTESYVRTENVCVPTARPVAVYVPPLQSWNSVRLTILHSYPNLPSLGTPNPNVTLERVIWAPCAGPDEMIGAGGVAARSRAVATASTRRGYGAA